MKPRKEGVLQHPLTADYVMNYAISRPSSAWVRLSRMCRGQFSTAVRVYVWLFYKSCQQSPASNYLYITPQISRLKPEQRGFSVEWRNDLWAIRVTSYLPNGPGSLPVSSFVRRYHSRYLPPEDPFKCL
ncbi:hypothetical protein NP493_385g04013 [Ridgeia piscesae]|uniref:Uncharacterized protein n=1 Tax=Ridgeia piscesae TaxID=27915 RepID=A0AAD9L288_RIDPI|nr:hypothetical protein NP493_385g04013 [Ridgeia piscesae]